VPTAPPEQLEHGRTALDAVAFEVTVFQDAVELGLFDDRIRKGQHLEVPALDRHQLSIEREKELLIALAAGKRAKLLPHHPLFALPEGDGQMLENEGRRMLIGRVEPDGAGLVEL